MAYLFIAGWHLKKKVYLIGSRISYGRLGQWQEGERGKVGQGLFNYVTSGVHL